MTNSELLKRKGDEEHLLRFEQQLQDYSRTRLKRVGIAVGILLTLVTVCFLCGV